MYAIVADVSFAYNGYYISLSVDSLRDAEALNYANEYFWCLYL